MIALSGELLRAARAAAGLSQNDVARRAGVAQSVISAYEAGQRQPSLVTLEKLIQATGHRLVVGLEPISPSVRGLPSTRLGRQLRQRRNAILRLADKHGASNVRVFGSAARGDDGPGSDIDVLVDLAPGTGLFGLGELRSELSALLGRPVDVVPADGLKPHVAARVAREVISL